MSPANHRPTALLADLVALGRYDRPIGIWLLAWPCAWGAALARPAPAELAALCVILLTGAALARAGGCAWNDLMDRELDASVARTRNRPLAAGRIGTGTACAFIAVHVIAAAALLLLLPPAAVWLVPGSLPLVLLYPLAKRFTWWPQVWLGFTFNWGALVGWSAATGSWPTAGALLLYAGCILWTIGYDTLYAYQDRADDVTTGIRSAAVRLGLRGRWFVAGAYVIAAAVFAAALAVTGAGPAAWLGLAGFSVVSAWYTATVDLEDAASCWIAFRGAHRAALVWFVGLATDLVLASSAFVR